MTRGADDDSLGDAVVKRARAPGTSTTPDSSPVRPRKKGSGTGTQLKNHPARTKQQLQMQLRLGEVKN
jgi:hypothetical protein